MMLQEQLIIKFGNDTVRTTKKQAAAFINDILSRGWLQSRKQVYNGEGGLQSMIVHASALALYAESIEDGFVEYSRYLRSLYRRHNTGSGRGAEVLTPPSRIHFLVDSGGNPPAVSGWASTLYPSTSYSFLADAMLAHCTPAEREVLECWMHVGSAIEVAEILQKNPKTVRTYLERAKRRIKENDAIMAFAS